MMKRLLRSLKQPMSSYASLGTMMSNFQDTAYFAHIPETSGFTKAGEACGEPCSPSEQMETSTGGVETSVTGRIFSYSRVSKPLSAATSNDCAARNHQTASRSSWCGYSFIFGFAGLRVCGSAVHIRQTCTPALPHTSTPAILIPLSY